MRLAGVGVVRGATRTPNGHGGGGYVRGVLCF